MRIILKIRCYFRESCCKTCLVPPDLARSARRAGAERPAGERRAAGAPESSPIRFAAERDGVYVAVSVADEGRGHRPSAAWRGPGTSFPGERESMDLAGQVHMNSPAEHQCPCPPFGSTGSRRGRRARYRTPPPHAIGTPGAAASFWRPHPHAVYSRPAPGPRAGPSPYEVTDRKNNPSIDIVVGVPVWSLSGSMLVREQTYRGRGDAIWSRQS